MFDISSLRLCGMENGHVEAYTIRPQAQYQVAFMDCVGQHTEKWLLRVTNNPPVAEVAAGELINFLTRAEVAAGELVNSSFVLDHV